MCCFIQHIKIKLVRYVFYFIVRKTVNSPHMFCISSDIKTIVQLNLIALRFDSELCLHHTSLVRYKSDGKYCLPQLWYWPLYANLRRWQGKHFFPKLTSPRLITHIQTWLHFTCQSPALIFYETWLNACELVSLIM